MKRPFLTLLPAFILVRFAFFSAQKTFKAMLMQRKLNEIS